jgi:hypothetical protein
MLDLQKSKSMRKFVQMGTAKDVRRSRLSPANKENRIWKFIMYMNSVKEVRIVLTRLSLFARPATVESIMRKMETNITRNFERK